jgi:periplasmic protein CpxP/Spy
MTSRQSSRYTKIRDGMGHDRADCAIEVYPDSAGRVLECKITARALPCVRELEAQGDIKGTDIMKRPLNVWLAALALTGVTSLGFAQPPPPSAQASTPAAAQMHGRMHGRVHEHPFMRILQQLDLTAEQKAKIRSIYSAARPQMESLGKSTRENMQTLMATAPSDASYAALVESAKANALAHIKLISDTQAQIYAVLTPEQQAKIPGVVAAEKAKWEAARQKRQAAPAAPMQP